MRKIFFTQEKNRSIIGLLFNKNVKWPGNDKANIIYFLNFMIIFIGLFSAYRFFIEIVH